MHSNPLENLANNNSLHPELKRRGYSPTFKLYSNQISFNYNFVQVKTFQFCSSQNITISTSIRSRQNDSSRTTKRRWALPARCQHCATRVEFCQKRKEFFRARTHGRSSGTPPPIRTISSVWRPSFTNKVKKEIYFDSSNVGVRVKIWGCMFTLLQSKQIFFFQKFSSCQPSHRHHLLR